MMTSPPYPVGVSFCGFCRRGFSFPCGGELLLDSYEVIFVQLDVFVVVFSKIFSYR